MTKPEREAEASEHARLWRLEKRRLEALGQLTAGFAHEFNNLLSVIGNSTYLLRRIEDETRRAALLQQIEAATRRGAELTRRLPNFGRLQGAPSRILLLQERAGELEDLMRHVVRSDIKVHLELPGDLWPVEVAYGELQLSLLQLCVNAREATPDGGTLQLRARNRVFEHSQAAVLAIGAGEHVELTVSDSGCGLSPDIVQHARAVAARDDERPQMEQGLVQVCGFVRRARGGLQVDSRAGAGTAISLMLPRARPMAPASTTRPSIAGQDGEWTA